MAGDKVRVPPERTRTGETAREPSPPPQPASPPGMADMERVNAWLRQRIAARQLHCPLETPEKQHGPYIVAQHLIALTTAPNAPGQALGATTYPSFMLICETCGYEMLFNWGVILAQTELGKPDGE